jgi:hypothetical protein
MDITTKHAKSTKEETFLFGFDVLSFVSSSYYYR